MHPALQLDEVLLNIFSRCDPPSRTKIRHFGKRATSRSDSFIIADLAVLARTCRTFKEPALDMLWSELVDLTPLARCLPQVCYPITGHHGSPIPRCGGVEIRPGWYLFHRPLNQDEWDTLRSYAHRVRSIHNFGSAFHADCIRAFLTPPTPNPLFPNLRHLQLTFGNEITPLLHQPLPSLISLNYSFTSHGNPPVLQESLESFPRGSSNLAQIYIRVSRSDVTIDQIVSEFICRWSNPRILFCDQVTLSADAILHLSCTPELTRLTFTLGTALPDQITPSKELCFNRLQGLWLFCASLSSVSMLLGRVQLPALTDLSVKFEEHPSIQDLASFLTALQISRASDSIMKLRLAPRHPRIYASSLNDILVCDDIRPTKAFKNLRCLDLNFNWNVALTDDDLLDLTSAWPYLEIFLINSEWGWQRGLDGITLEGVARLLQTCPSLTELALAIDTRSCPEVPFSVSSLRRGSNFTSSLTLHVLDSVINPATVPAVAAFLADNVPAHQVKTSPYGYIGLNKINMKYADIWRDVFARVNKELGTRQRYRSGD